MNALAVLVAAQPSQASLTTSLMWLGGIIAAIRRKQPIGGWLFFFLWQIVAGCAMTFVYTNWAGLLPRAWNGQGKYFVYVLVTMPRIAALLALAWAGAMLIRTYDWKWVVVLRYVLILFSILGAANVAADAFLFPSRVGLEAATLIFPVVFTVYFFVSTRVRSVFVDHVWNQHAVSGGV